MKTIIDLFNMLHVSFSIAQTQAMREKGSFTEDDVGLYYHKVLDSVIGISKDYGRLIFANEGRGSLDWRRSIYPDYKANRKRDDTYQIFKNHLKDVEKLLSYFPSKMISVDGAEADDIMYGLSTYFADNGEDVLIITGDRDIAQLVNYSDKIRVYAPTLRMFREKQPNLILEKAIVGDPSDNIPGIPRVGIKTFEKALKDRNVWNSKIEPNRDIVDKFIQIVDLSKAPANLKEEAIIQYNSRDYAEFAPQEIEMFMFEHKLNEHLSRWSSDLNDINMALYKNDSMNGSEKKIEMSDLNEVESMLDFINNL